MKPWKSGFFFISIKFLKFIHVVLCVRYVLLFEKIDFIFPSSFGFHSKMERKVQRILVYPLPHHGHSLPQVITPTRVGHEPDVNADNQWTIYDKEWKRVLLEPSWGLARKYSLHQGRTWSREAWFSAQFYTLSEQRTYMKPDKGTFLQGSRRDV